MLAHTRVVTARELTSYGWDIPLAGDEQESEYTHVRHWWRAAVANRRPFEIGVVVSRKRFSDIDARWQVDEGAFYKIVHDDGKHAVYRRYELTVLPDSISCLICCKRMVEIPTSTCSEPHKHVRCAQCSPSGWAGCGRTSILLPFGPT